MKQIRWPNIQQTLQIRRQLVASILFIVLLGSIGTYLLIHSHAATSTASLEAENGVLSGATNVADSNASGGHAIKFGSSSGGTGSSTMQSSLLSVRSGYGAAATGGNGGAVVTVTNANDSGPGSLRAAVAGNSPKWVIFNGDYTIRIPSSGADNSIKVGSNTTIDGRGHNVIITGCMTTGSITCANQTYGMEVGNATNVILENFTVSGFGDVSKTSSNDPYNGLYLVNSHTVWIDHMNITHTGNKGLGIQSNSYNVTVSWSHFYDIDQTFQIGDQYDRAGSIGQIVTIHHNFFDQTGYRNPSLAIGKMHYYNNYVYQWQTYGMRSERTGQAISQNNVFEAGSDTTATLVRPSDDGCNDKNTLCDGRLGFIRSSGDIALNGAKIITNETAGSICKTGSQCEQLTNQLPNPNPPTFFTVPYQYTLDATNSASAINALKANVSGHAGWQNIGISTTPTH